jgi:hypothetical protein
MKTAKQWQEELAGETSLESITEIQIDARKVFVLANEQAHMLFHEPMEIGEVEGPENNGSIDWATYHGPGEDYPLFFIKHLREHLVRARRKIQQLRATKE